MQAIARRYLEHEDIADKQVTFLGEVQILLGPYCKVRHEMYSHFEILLLVGYLLGICSCFHRKSCCVTRQCDYCYIL